MTFAHAHNVALNDAQCIARFRAELNACTSQLEMMAKCKQHGVSRIYSLAQNEWIGAAVGEFALNLLTRGLG